MFVDAVRELGREAERERESWQPETLVVVISTLQRGGVCMACVDTRKRERGCLSQTVAKFGQAILQEACTWE